MAGIAYLSWWKNINRGQACDFAILNPPSIGKRRRLVPEVLPSDLKSVKDLPTFNHRSQ